jgi:hypothetical protein
MRLSIGWGKQPSCIEALHRWSSALSSAPSTLLIVLSHSDCSESVATAAEFRERCFEWSLDHGFEVIDANCTAPEEGDDPRDKTGIPRVMEALESTMWSSMTMKPRGGSQFSSVVSASSRPAALPMTPIIVEEKAHKPEAVDVAEPLSGEDVARITSDRILDDVPEVSDRLEGMLDNLESLMQQVRAWRGMPHCLSIVGCSFHGTAWWCCRFKAYEVQLVANPTRIAVRTPLRLQ